MPTALERFYLDAVGTSKTELMTVDANLTASVNWLRVTNVTAGAVVASAYIWPLGNSGNEVVWWPSISLAANQSFQFRGARYLLATDEIHIQSDTASSLDVQTSWLEKGVTDPVPSRARELVQGVTTIQTVYTYPATRAAVNDLTIVNTSGGAVTITVDFVVGATTINLLRSHSLDASGSGALWEYAGVINGLSGDLLKVTASGTVDVLVSAQET